jgi:hypothetical protein
MLGNPPFVGAKYMNDAQRADMARRIRRHDNAGLLDFVAAWYVKAARYHGRASGDSRRVCVHQLHHPGRAGRRVVGLAAGTGREGSILPIAPSSGATKRAARPLCIA